MTCHIWSLMTTHVVITLQFAASRIRPLCLTLIPAHARTLRSGQGAAPRFRLISNLHVLHPNVTNLSRHEMICSGSKVAFASLFHIWARYVLGSQLPHCTFISLQARGVIRTFPILTSSSPPPRVLVRRAIYSPNNMALLTLQPH